LPHLSVSEVTVRQAELRKLLDDALERPVSSDKTVAIFHSDACHVAEPASCIRISCTLMVSLEHFSPKILFTIARATGALPLPSSQRKLFIKVAALRRAPSIEKGSSEASA
jgi:hypothetical protein